MADKTKADATVDTAKSKATDESSETTGKSIAEEAAETTKPEVEESSKPLETETETTEETEESTEDGESTEETEETKEVAATVTEQTDGEEAESEVDDISDLLGSRKKDGAQKRIDKLTAQLRTTQEELAKVTTQQTTSTGDKTYTDVQLKSAMRKAMDDGDSDLVFEIIQQKTKQSEANLTKKYEAEKTKQREDVKRNATEWTQVVKSYDYLSDADEPEIYHGSRLDLNLKDSNSLLRRVALAFYSSEDEELFQLYHRPGGQSLAVADALNVILAKRRGNKPEDKEKKHLKKRLTKERRKKSLTSGSGALKQDTVPKVKKVMNDKERVLEAINDRKIPLHKLRESWK